MGAHFWINGQRTESNVYDREIIDADDVLDSGHLRPRRDVIVKTPDGQARLVNPGSKIQAIAGSEFVDVPPGTRGGDAKELQ